MEYSLVARWLLAYAVLFLAGVPIAARLFRRLDGRGAGFALPVALTTLALPVYWLGHVRYGPLTVGAGAIVLLAVAALAGLDRAAIRERRVALASDLTIDRAAVREVAVVFALAFLLVVAIRAVDPAVGPLGGEKFLDFGLLKSLARATALPPEDVWFAGDPVRYYYGGHLIASILATLTATHPRFGYNLALAGFYATLVAAAYDLAGAVGVERDLPRRTAGAFGAFFVGFAANLLTAGQVLLAILPGPLREPLAGRIAASAAHLDPEDLRGGVEFSYWSASRVIEGTINEFPLFAWLNGDLHAHMTGLPFLLFGAGLSLAYYLTPDRERRRRRLLAFGAVPILTGLLAVVDTWSVPSLYGLLALALIFAPADPWTLFPRRIVDWRDRMEGSRAETIEGNRTEPAGIVAELSRLSGAAAATAIAGLLGALLAAPFLLTAAGGRDIAVVPADARSGLGALLLVHGAFLIVFLAYLLARLRASRGERGDERHRLLPLIGALIAVAVVASSQDLAVGLIVAPLLALGWVALRMDRSVGFETVLILAGAGLVALVEFVYVVEQAGPLRLNTVFKTYIQVWVLWSVGAGVAAAALLSAPVARDGSPRAADGGGDPAAGAGVAGGTRQLARSLRQHATTALVVALVLSTALYGAFALGEHFAAARDEPTLDATAFVAADHPDRAEAIAYVDSLEGTPTMLSAPATSRCPGGGGGCEPGMYSFDSSPAASLTGVPTVAGWAHEIGYRGADPYRQRVDHVDRFYTGSPEERAAILRAYEVEYVWVGPTERDRYGTVDVDMSGLDVAHSSGAVTVYRVDHDRLPE